MNSKVVLLLLLYLLVLASSGNVSPFGANHLSSYSSNKGESTFYKFTFTADNQITENGSINIIFPQEYSASSFSSQIECAVKQDALYLSYPCAYQSGNVVNINVGTIK